MAGFPVHVPKGCETLNTVPVWRRRVLAFVTRHGFAFDDTMTQLKVVSQLTQHRIVTRACLTKLFHFLHNNTWICIQWAFTGSGGEDVKTDVGSG